MSISRRDLIKNGLLGAAVGLRPGDFAGVGGKSGVGGGSGAGARLGVGEGLAGPFEGTRASLRAYEIPEWFRDAKFGIWAH